MLVIARVVENKKEEPTYACVPVTYTNRKGYLARDVGKGKTKRSRRDRRKDQRVSRRGVKAGKGKPKGLVGIGEETKGSRAQEGGEKRGRGVVEARVRAVVVSWTTVEPSI